MDVQHLTGDIYEVRIEHVRVFVLENTPESNVTLIDTGFEYTASALVETLNNEFGEIDRLILTHDGPDHYGGVDAVVDCDHASVVILGEFAELKRFHPAKDSAKVFGQN